MDIFDAAERYQAEGKSVVILAGKEYGSGSSRDWAAKGPYLLVKHKYIICGPCKFLTRFFVSGSESNNCRIL